MGPGRRHIGFHWTVNGHGLMSPPFASFVGILSYAWQCYRDLVGAFIDDHSPLAGSSRYEARMRMSASHLGAIFLPLPPDRTRRVARPMLSNHF